AADAERGRMTAICRLLTGDRRFFFPYRSAFVPILCSHLHGIQWTDTMPIQSRVVGLVKCLIMCDLVGYPSGQRGQTVNLLAYAFDGSNPSPTTIPFLRGEHQKTPMFTM